MNHIGRHHTQATPLTQKGSRQEAAKAMETLTTDSFDNKPYPSHGAPHVHPRFEWCLGLFNNDPPFNKYTATGT